MTETVLNPPKSKTVHPTEREPANLSAWQKFSFTCMRVIIKGTLRLFGLNGLYKLSCFFGWLEFLVDYKRRKRTYRIQSVVWNESTPKSERRKWVIRNFIRLRCDKVFYLIFDLLPKDKLAECFEIENRGALDDGVARNKGVYAMTSHIGSTHVIGMLTAFLGYSISGVRAPNEGAMRRFVQERWDQKYPDCPPIILIYTGDFVRPIYRLFKDNYILGSSLDVTKIPDENMRTIPVKLFGKEQQFLLGPLLIAIRCKTTILQAFSISLPGFRYRLDFLGPFTDPEKPDESPEALARIMQEYADNIVEYAHRYPDHITKR